ncbi:MAG TPA: hypothetical protein VGH11_17735 [Jatrophihabitans sp.]
MTETTTSPHRQGNTMSNIKQKLRHRRSVRQFERALDSASPAMRTELMAMAARQNFSR